MKEATEVEVDMLVPVREEEKVESQETGTVQLVVISTLPAMTTAGSVESQSHVVDMVVVVAELMEKLPVRVGREESQETGTARPVVISTSRAMTIAGSVASQSLVLEVVTLEEIEEIEAIGEIARIVEIVEIEEIEETEEIEEIEATPVLHPLPLVEEAKEKVESLGTGIVQHVETSTLHAMTRAGSVGSQSHLEQVAKVKVVEERG